MKYKPIETLIDNEKFCQKIIQKKQSSLSRLISDFDSCKFLLTILEYNDANIVVPATLFAPKENNITQILSLTQLKQPNIVKLH